MREQKKMPIMEIFGPTIQGEGMVIGRKTMFVRTGGCDYSCSWCDSAFTWNGEEKAKVLSSREVYDEIEEIGYIDNVRNFNHVTITGGNPALINKPMNDLIDMLHNDGVKVGLETQGSIYQDWFLKIDDLTISPKPPSSNMETNFNILDDIIDKLNEGNVNFSLKVVIFNEEDFEYAKYVHNRYKKYNRDFYVSVGNPDPYENGNISQRLLNDLKNLWDLVLNDPDANDFKPLPQLHALIYDNERGV